MKFEISPPLLAAAFCLATTACHANPDDKPGASAPASASPRPMLTLNVPPPGQPSARPPHPPITHTIVFADHRHLTELDTGDFIESPDDDAYDWSPRWNGPTVFEPVEGAPPGRIRFRAAKPGGAQLLLASDPKCLKTDAGCNLPRREWTLFYVVH